MDGINVDAISSHQSMIYRSLYEVSWWSAQECIDFANMSFTNHQVPSIAMNKKSTREKWAEHVSLCKSELTLIKLNRKDGSGTCKTL